MTAVGMQDANQAMLEMSLLNAEYAHKSFDDFVIAGVSGGIPPEVLLRLKDLWEKTKVVSGEVIHIGKVIVAKIIAFLKANPKLTASLAIGAAVFVLSNCIPFIGPWLAPILATLTSVGILAKSASLDEAIEIAKGFFQLVIDTFNRVLKKPCAIHANGIISHSDSTR